MSHKNIGIVHYRIGRTDGVSLEIEKRKQILQRLGHTVKLISGPIQCGADFVIDELEFDSDEVKAIKENSFKYFGESNLSSAELMARIESLAKRIEHAFLSYHRDQRFDALLVHNIFSHGRHIAAASAFARIANDRALPIIATHHDYFWEREEYKEPRDSRIQQYLTTFVPADLSSVTHISINSLARSELLRKRGVDSIVFPDIFDFDQPQWIADDYNADFLERIGVNHQDLVVLQATRIVERKGIETAIQFVNELEKRKQDLIGVELYNGKKLSVDSSIVLVLAGYAERSAQGYLQKLKTLIREYGINAKFIHEYIAAERSREPQKVYSLWDAYAHADFVTYPSLQEGWGNQFIEAIFAKKPIALFEYPVFLADIKQEDFEYISFGDKFTLTPPDTLAPIPEAVMVKAVRDAVAWLTSDSTKTVLERNYEIGKRHHSYNILEAFLADHLNR